MSQIHSPVPSPVILSEAKDLTHAGTVVRLRKAFFPLSFLFLLLASLSASAQTLTGTVKNSTTGKPAA
jgi:hypothetical protein